MVLRPRTRLQLRRAVVATALGALLVPAVADAKAKAPVITKVTPKTASVGTKLTIQGKHFRRGKAKNSVLFRRDKGKALFVKADVSTAKKLTVVVPKKLEKYMVTKGGVAVPTRFRLRILASRLSKSYSAARLSPVIGPEKVKDGNNSDGAGVAPPADGDCDGDGQKNSVDGDDDNDLLADGHELALKLDPCVLDTDGDGVEDGFEFQSAVMLNDDDYQNPNYSLPYPGKTPYPNPLFADADKDFDGDGLDLGTEHKLWKYTYEVNHTATRTLSPPSYSDGTQYSLSRLEHGDHGRRVPNQSIGDYQPPQQFRAWADANGYGSVLLFDPDSSNPHVPSAFDLFDMDRDGVVTLAPSGLLNQLWAERRYWNHDNDNWVSDDERDEDADGLTNYHETNGPMTLSWWTGCYTKEGPYPIPYASTKPYDADTDGDTILDGADDQDFDDVPNVMELSRNMAGNLAIQAPCAGSAAQYGSAPATTWVHPFNPCLPDIQSRTCQRHPIIKSPYPPFDPAWIPLVLN